MRFDTWSLKYFRVHVPYVHDKSVVREILQPGGCQLYTHYDYLTLKQKSRLGTMLKKQFLIKIQSDLLEAPLWFN